MLKAVYDQWYSVTDLDPIKIICGYCGQHVGISKGYKHLTQPYKIYICSFCGLPTLILGECQFPGPLLGRDVTNLPEDIASIYHEIRESVKNTSFTGAILLGRKLIMHLAISVTNAPEGKSFVEYIEYLKTANYIPPNGEQLLVFIKNLGNDKNHKLKIGSKEEAEKILKFIESLLIFMFELPADFEEKKD